MFAGDRLFGAHLHPNVRVYRAADDHLLARAEGEHGIAEPDDQRWTRNSGHRVLLFSCLSRKGLHHAHRTVDEQMTCGV
ncbi:hypothetical protein H7H51_16460 [Mycolicibacterium farcinogenes]|nr:hypothetical protein [Mycolicibacterium farcinogenes]